MQVLRGQLVILRTLEREDCRRYWHLVETEERPTETFTPGLSVEQADRWFEEIQRKQGHEQIYLGIFLPDGKLIGDIQLAKIQWRDRNARLGFGVLPAWRNRGYATDAAITLLRYGFDYLNLHRVVARTAAFNVSAQRVLEKCGFRQEGREREAIYLGGTYEDMLIYGLLRSEFKPGGRGETSKPRGPRP